MAYPHMSRLQARESVRRLCAECHSADAISLSMRAQIFVEYVMLNGVNDGPETARELGALVRGRNMLVNLIPWNPVYSPGMQFEAPGTQRVRLLRPAALPALAWFAAIADFMMGKIACPAYLTSCPHKAARTLCKANVTFAVTCELWVTLSSC